MLKDRYYDGTKLLEKKDLNDREPAIYISTTNRSAGKTTFFLKYLLSKFKNDGSQFCIVYRYKYELSSCDSIFKDVLLLYPDLGQEMTSKSYSGGVFYQLILDDVVCGYAVALSNPDTLKKYSPVFARVDYLLMDEFQTENGKYLTNETTKLQSVYMTIARGGGKQHRNVKLFMLGNMVSVLNPYFLAFGIDKRLLPDTKFLRGTGWVAEFGYNESSANAIKNNPFANAFAESDYIKYSTEKKYLVDTSSFIKKPTGKLSYNYTIIYNDISYSVKENKDTGEIYISKKVDKNFPFTYCFKSSDHKQGRRMVERNSFIFGLLKASYEYGVLYFEDLDCKNMFMDIMRISLYE